MKFDKDEKREQFTVRLKPSKVNLMDSVVEGTPLSRSDIMRMAIDSYLGLLFDDDVSDEQKTLFGPYPSLSEEDVPDYLLRRVERIEDDKEKEGN